MPLDRTKQDQESPYDEADDVVDPWAEAPRLPWWQRLWAWLHRRLR
jgi:hypothetical protein